MHSAMLHTSSRLITAAGSLHGSCTEVCESGESPKEIFMEDDITSVRKWGIESHHGSHASFRYCMIEADIVTNLVPWFARFFWKCRHPILSTQMISPGWQEVRNNRHVSK